ncbi:MAG: hypothetical protein ACRYG6_09240 [Janthinobacterium lividum]
MNPKTIAMQDAAAQALVAMIDDHWERIGVNYEMDRTPEGRVLDSVIFYITADPDGSLRKTSVRLASDEMNDRIIELADAMAQDGETWGSCDLVVDSNGKYGFKFDYAPPRRINGVFDDASMGRFDTYLDTYRVERAAAVIV